ncbi:MAG: imidazole glycerol phosphate synthase subunit HisH [Candidatus Omnitrophica bacterium]|nr:imidazole glycerol phosphate synthase subunit HisH [Candidatus Omnitrophota bacterium]
MIAIVDYGMGNIHSVKKALEAMGGKTVVTNKHADLKKAAKIVLPGVGAFGDAVRELEKLGLAEAIREQIRDKKIFLGICLGMHLLFDTSEESVGLKGLGVFAGGVKKFSAADHLKVPHMGWNQIEFRNTACPLFKGLADDSSVYFCHSYYPQPKDTGLVAAATDYGIEFASILWEDNVFATQFHPEKSQGIGLKILENFVKL